MKIIICHLVSDVTGAQALGAGRTQPEALEDAIKNFTDKRPEIVQDHLKRRLVSAEYHDREVRNGK